MPGYKLIGFVDKQEIIQNKGIHHKITIESVYFYYISKVLLSVYKWMLKKLLCMWGIIICNFFMMVMLWNKYKFVWKLYTVFKCSLLSQFALALKLLCMVYMVLDKYLFYYYVYHDF